MMKIASSVPVGLSGMSGLVRAKDSLTGQQKSKDNGVLGWLVRDVRGKSNCLTCAHPRARKSGGDFSFKNPLGSLFLPGQARQERKGVDFVLFLPVRAKGFRPDRAGHPGQTRGVNVYGSFPNLDQCG